jgi:hypothetical protein
MAVTSYFVGSAAAAVAAFLLHLLVELGTGAGLVGVLVPLLALLVPLLWWTLRRGKGVAPPPPPSAPLFLGASVASSAAQAPVSAHDGSTTVAAAAASASEPSLPPSPIAVPAVVPAPTPSAAPAAAAVAPPLLASPAAPLARSATLLEPVDGPRLPALPGVTPLRFDDMFEFTEARDYLGSGLTGVVYACRPKAGLHLLQQQGAGTGAGANVASPCPSPPPPFSDLPPELCVKVFKREFLSERPLAHVRKVRRRTPRGADNNILESVLIPPFPPSTPHSQIADREDITSSIPPNPFVARSVYTFRVRDEALKVYTSIHAVMERAPGAPDDLAALQRLSAEVSGGA